MDPNVIWEFQLKLQEQVQKFHDKERDRIPDYLFDWTPFFSALCEGNRVNGVHTILAPHEDGDADTPSPNGGIRDHRTSVAPRWQPQVIPKKPGSGSWDYSWYIPEWSHPDFEPNVRRNFKGEVRFMSNKDPINQLFPALRPVDAFRQPTEWAKRFGIHPDEPGGRSRLSPTTSHTRNAFEDFENQISMLNAEEKDEVVAASRMLAIQQGINIPAGSSDYIHPQVMESMLRNKGFTSLKMLRQSLNHELGKHSDKSNLDAFTSKLKEVVPQAYELHKGYLEAALHDQEYQRLIFSDMTSDELISDKILSMSNDNVVCDLEGEINEFFQRERWELSDWKGTLDYEPRFVYNLNGVREEWDVTTNDTLWQALQPALQLVTKVINGKHPALEALMDLRTRRRIPADKDIRTKPETPFMWTYGPQYTTRREDMLLPVRQLDEEGWVWSTHIMATLRAVLSVDIGSVFLSSTPGEDGQLNEFSAIAYGTTRCMPAGPDSKIVISIGAELIWPLLVPQLSQSEKLVTSFAIATTLLHEFAHAISQAQQLMTLDEHWGRSWGYGPVTIERLLSIGPELWDYPNCAGEHYWRDNADSESGFDFEQALWGMPIVNLLSHSGLNNSRLLQSVPYVLSGFTFPFPQNPVEPGYQRGPIKGAIYPVEEYRMPIPIDYVAKFFRQQFWTMNYNLYGPTALRIYPSRVIKGTMSPDYLSDQEARVNFGRSEWAFVQFVSGMLKANDYFTLGEYIIRVAQQAMSPGFYVNRWRAEVANWQNAILNPLNENVDMADRAIVAANLAWVCRFRPGDREGKYMQYALQNDLDYVQGKTITPTLSRQAWLQSQFHQYGEIYRVGGQLMRAIAAVHESYMAELRFMERMVFDYFNIYPSARVQYNNPSVPNHPIAAAAARLFFDRNRIRRLYTIMNTISTIIGIEHVRNHYVDWAAKLRYCHQMYERLYLMIAKNEDLKDDKSWRKHFHTIPSSYWKSKLDRIQPLVGREYIRVDPRIRRAVDECMSIIQRYQGAKDVVPAFPPEEQVAQEALMKVIQDSKEFGHDIPTTDGPNMFTWTVPDEPPGGWPTNATNFQPDVPPPPSARRAPEHLNVVFGSASTLPGTSLVDAKLPEGAFVNTPEPTWHNAGSSSSSSSRGRNRVKTGGNIRGSSSGNVGDTRSGSGGRGGRRASRGGRRGDGSGSGSDSGTGHVAGELTGALGPSREGGIRRESGVQIRGFTPVNAHDKGKNFVQGAQKVGALEQIAELEIPTKSITTSMKPTTFGPGGPILSGTGGSSIFNVIERPSILRGLFPHANASATTLTSDLKAHERAQLREGGGPLLFRLNLQQLEQSGIEYHQPSLSYREADAMSDRSSVNTPPERFPEASREKSPGPPPTQPLSTNSEQDWGFDSSVDLFDLNPGETWTHDFDAGKPDFIFDENPPTPGRSFYDDENNNIM
ncbi:hypothetical protein F4804DRAFT_291271 [Jackrogersella minutella]|nr:hypothetical protein F4804DRAFT_291271 [Jackrogersella minutella]